jgi:hypothetical protein
MDLWVNNKLETSYGLSSIDIYVPDKESLMQGMWALLLGEDWKDLIEHTQTQLINGLDAIGNHQYMTETLRVMSHTV